MTHPRCGGSLVIVTHGAIDSTRSSPSRADTSTPACLRRLRSTSRPRASCSPPPELLRTGWFRLASPPPNEPPLIPNPLAPQEHRDLLRPLSNARRLQQLGLRGHRQLPHAQQHVAVAQPEVPGEGIGRNTLELEADRTDEERQAARWCADDNIAKARVIDAEFAEANFEVDDTDELHRKEGAAMKTAARKLGVSVKEADDLYMHVSTACVRQLQDRSTTCTSQELEIARALEEAHFQHVTRIGTDPMVALKADNRVTKGVAKRFGIGPVAAERIREKTLEHCPSAL